MLFKDMNKFSNPMAQPLCTESEKLMHVHIAAAVAVGLAVGLAALTHQNSVKFPELLITEVI